MEKPGNKCIIVFTTGDIPQVSYRIANGRTEVTLELESRGAVFLVFSGNAETDSLKLPEIGERVLLTLEGPWNLEFEKNRGAPENVVLQELQSWREHQDPGIRYFSGRATYTNSFTAPDLSEGETLILDLGEVNNIAGVRLNGKEVGTLWKRPYRIEISEAVQEGENRLEVAVTNTWVSRFIGDAQPGVGEKITFTTMPFYQANGELLPAGLLGEVRLLKQSGQ